MSALEPVKFSEAYDLANEVWSHLVEWSPPEDFDDFLDPEHDEVASRLLKPQRDTALHLFLRRIYWQHYVWGFEHHRNDMLDLIVNAYETILRFNEVPFKTKELPPEQAHNFEHVAKGRIAYLRQKLPVNRIAQDTFQLLFRDRAFLRRFNEILSRAVRGLVGTDSTPQLTRQGTVRRVSLPSWMKRGIFYRDNGRCICCGSDLTGVMFNGPDAHYDHIVPLATFGSNDPTNFQLLCSSCNTTKSTKSVTWQRYPVFWAAPDVIPSNKRMERIGMKRGTYPERRCADRSFAPR